MMTRGQQWCGDFRLKPLQPADAAAVAALAAVCFPDPWSKNMFSQTLSMPGVQGLVAAAMSVPGRVAGMVMYRFAADEAEILLLGVGPGFRRHGLAACLLELSLRVLEAGKINHVFLEVARDNVAAARLYEKAGFRVVAQRPAYYRRPSGPAQDALIMVRKTGAAGGPEGRAGL